MPRTFGKIIAWNVLTIRLFIKAINNENYFIKDIGTLVCYVEIIEG